MADTLALFCPDVAETDGVIVRVAVSYLADQSSPGAGRWFWSYHIRLENRREQAVQLLARHWVISDARGKVHEVKGAGVVGDTPRIAPGDSYDYVSGCHMVDEDGSTFDVAIPRFALVGPAD